MAASRKPRSAERKARGAVAAILAAAHATLGKLALRGQRLAVAYSGGVDSTVLLHVLQRLASEQGYRLSALHVHHGLSGNADAWRLTCLRTCRALGVPFTSRRISVRKAGQGLEAAARAARRQVFAALRVDAIALGHQLDDQAETVLFNLLRGTGLAGASGMPAIGQLGRKQVLRPLLEVPRETILAYAQQMRLNWVEDESNADQALTRNFIRRQLGPLLVQRFPRWRESLARAARHFATARLDERTLLREFLAARGLRAPSETRLVEMLKQLASGSGRAEVKHDGVVLRAYRGTAQLDRERKRTQFDPVRWQGEGRLHMPALGGELRFRRVRGKGIDLARIGEGITVRLRTGGERLQPDARRPRRTLKNLFQEAGVPPWQRAALPMLFCGNRLVWVPGLGVDAAYATGRGAAGILPEWRPSSS